MAFLFDTLQFLVEASPALIVHQTQFTTNFGQTQVGVIFTQHQTVFSARCEHTVRFFGTQRTQVVHQHAKISLIATRCPTFFFSRQTCGVQTSQHALCGGFFITGCTVNLARKEQTLDEFTFQSRFQVARIEEIILNRVARADDSGIFHPLHRADNLHLHIERQAGGDAIRVNFVRGQSFRFEEDLMLVTIGKAHHFVFDRRAVAWADTFDHASVHWATIEVIADHVMGFLIGMRDVTRHLARMLRSITQE